MHDGRATDDDNGIDHCIIDVGVLDGFSLTFSLTFSRRRPRGSFLGENGDVEVHGNWVHVHPMVINEIARGTIDIRVTGVGVCGSFQQFICCLETRDRLVTHFE
jgi:hypothetical protein